MADVVCFYENSELLRMLELSSPGSGAAVPSDGGGSSSLLYSLNFSSFTLFPLSLSSLTVSSLTLSSLSLSSLTLPSLTALSLLSFSPLLFSLLPYPPLPPSILTLLLIISSISPLLSSPGSISAAKGKRRRRNRVSTKDMNDTIAFSLANVFAPYDVQSTTTSTTTTTTSKSKTKTSKLLPSKHLAFDAGAFVRLTCPIPDAKV